MTKIVPLPLVLKLGGSLAESGRLHAILDLVAGAQLPVVVVPGGGPFADAVRAIQPQLQLSDHDAHGLALLAMHQIGLVIIRRHARFAPVASLDEITSALAAAKIPVWNPFALQHDDTTIPADWTVTSDALAARLAERLGRAHVALLKSCAIPPDATLAALTSAGFVDPVFAKIVTRAGLTWRAFGAGDENRLAAVLNP